MDTMDLIYKASIAIIVLWYAYWFFWPMKSKKNQGTHKPVIRPTFRIREGILAKGSIETNAVFQKLPTPKPGKYSGITRVSEEIFLCRKVNFGKNGNFTRYSPIIEPTSKDLRDFMLQFQGKKGGNTR